MTCGDKAKKEVIPSFLFLFSFVDASRATVIQYSYNKNRGSDMTLPILDNILLHLLAKTISGKLYGLRHKIKKEINCDEER